MIFPNLVHTLALVGDPVLERLAEPHVVALLLDSAGVGRNGIAARLGIPPAAVDPLLAVARAKLARALEDDTGPEP